MSYKASIDTPAGTVVITNPDDDGVIEVESGEGTVTMGRCSTGAFGILAKGFAPETRTNVNNVERRALWVTLAQMTTLKKMIEYIFAKVEIKDESRAELDAILSQLDITPPSS